MNKPNLCLSAKQQPTLSRFRDHRHRALYGNWCNNFNQPQQLRLFSARWRKAVTSRHRTANRCHVQCAGADIITRRNVALSRWGLRWNDCHLTVMNGSGNLPCTRVEATGAMGRLGALRAKSMIRTKLRCLLAKHAHSIHGVALVSIIFGLPIYGAAWQDVSADFSLNSPEPLGTREAPRCANPERMSARRPRSSLASPSWCQRFPCR